MGETSWQKEIGGVVQDPQEMKFWTHLRRATVSETGVTDNEWFPFLAARGLDEVKTGGHDKGITFDHGAALPRLVRVRRLLR